MLTSSFKESCRYLRGIIIIELKTTQEERDEVLLEVQILRKASHQNIIGLIGAWSANPNELVVREEEDSLRMLP